MNMSAEIARATADPEVGLLKLLERSHDLAMANEVPAQEGEVPAQEGVVGYFPVYFPEELIHAAGLRPHAVLGGGTGVEMKLADAVIGSFVCSICRSTVELGLGGELAGMAAFYVPAICDAAKHLPGIWGRRFPSQPAEQLALPQNVELPAAVTFIRNEYERLRRDLGRLVGREVSDDSLLSSIVAYNENRELVRELYRLRAEDPGRLAAVECYLMVRAGLRLRVEEHSALLREALALLARRASRVEDKPRVVFRGGFCEQPPLAMIEAIEDSTFIVDDDLLLGRHWITEDVSPEGDPLMALAAAYVQHSDSSPVQHDSRKPMDRSLVDAVRRTRADGAIIAAPKFCEPGLDDQVLCCKALDAEGLPYLVLEFEERMTSFQQMAMQVETFGESLLFRQAVGRDG